MACPKCKVNPFAHSFERFGVTDTAASLYYTAPARMTSRDDYINLECWTLHLDTLAGPWIWFIDCANMELHHSITKQFVTVLGQILVEEHAARLKRIVVLNPNVWFYGVLHELYKHIRPDLIDAIWIIRRELREACAVLGVSTASMTWLRIAQTVEPNRRLEAFSSAPEVLHRRDAPEPGDSRPLPGAPGAP